MDLKHKLTIAKEELERTALDKVIKRFYVEMGIVKIWMVLLLPVLLMDPVLWGYSSILLGEEKKLEQIKNITCFIFSLCNNIDFLTILGQLFTFFQLEMLNR